VLLAARDGDAERGPHDVRLETGALAELPPPALLVDERLADVEERGRYRHRLGQCLTLELRRVCDKRFTAGSASAPVARPSNQCLALRV
jgi:hypothetical protein